MNESLLGRLIGFFLKNPVVAGVLLLLFVGWGLWTMPFDLPGDWARDPVPVDAIPDLGENQQIVFTSWPGRSPRDVEDQVTYPLTVALMGVPGVETVRSHSYFGFSSVYLIFEESIDFYWARARILEKLKALPQALPDGVEPALGPDATALGQIFWYTLEGRDPQGRVVGGWDLAELRRVQDWTVRYALLAADGVAEVASIGGYVYEYQIDVDPDAMRAFKVTLPEVFDAVRRTNIDVGARNLSLNQVEYFIRGVGFVQSKADLEQTVIKARDGAPVTVGDVATVMTGPAQRRGVLDDEGAEAVGGVVVARYGQNPREVIEAVRETIARIGPGLPRKTLADGTISQVTIAPFYDRTDLIQETVGTLRTALGHQVLITIIVVLIMIGQLRGAVLISAMLPVSVLLTFVAMRLFEVGANVVALSGIAIAIGAMVDMGIVMVENGIRRLKAEPDAPVDEVLHRAANEVGGAVLTAVATTVLSFLPVFAMQAAEGKLFKPLAFTKTFALLAAIVVSLTLLPALMHLIYARRSWRVGPVLRWTGLVILAALGGWVVWWLGLVILAWGVYRFEHARLPAAVRLWTPRAVNLVAALAVAWLLASDWTPLGPERGLWGNWLFVVGLIAPVLALFLGFQWLYPRVLAWAMAHRVLFLTAPLLVVVLGAAAWLGGRRVLFFMPDTWFERAPLAGFVDAFPGFGREFMPDLDEGSFLYMPTTSTHASIDEVIDILQSQDRSIRAIPEVERVVGKLGRVDSSLDPAPISMIETLITYKPRYLLDGQGRRRTFQFDYGERDLFRDQTGQPVRAPDGEPYRVQGRFARDADGVLIQDDDGMPFSLWRPALDPDINPGRARWRGIQSSDDIWDQITMAAKRPGVTDAPKLQPIATRLVMLSTGLRAPIGLKITGPNLAAVEAAGLDIERLLKEVPSLDPNKIFADRITGKPYLEIHIDRAAIARYGISMARVQEVIEVAIGGKTVTTVIDGRERIPVRVRYPRERRDTLDRLAQVLIPTEQGARVPLGQVAEVRYERGPQVLKSEDAFPVSYVILDKREDVATVDAVRDALAYLEQAEARGLWTRPDGVSYSFVGDYQNEQRASRRLAIVLPLSLVLIFLVLYLQFRSTLTTLLVFTGIGVAWAGGFLLMWAYHQPGFLDVMVAGVNLRDLFHIEAVAMSTAVWVGFLALFGIATDDGVLIATYLDQNFAARKPATVADVRAATIEAGLRRIRPAMMTSATTVIALLPVLSAEGKGSDMMGPMAIPTFGGMIAVVLSVFVVPVLYSLIQELKLPKP